MATKLTLKWQPTFFNELLAEHFPEGSDLEVLSGEETLSFYPPLGFEFTYEAKKQETKLTSVGTLVVDHPGELLAKEQEIKLGVRLDGQNTNHELEEERDVVNILIHDYGWKWDSV